MMPFPGGIEGTSNATLVIAAAAASLYLLLLNMRVNWLRTAVKTLPVALLAVLAGLENGPLLLAAALAFSAAGDAFLSRNGERPFLYGLAAFLIAHIAYAALFYLEGGGYAAIEAQAWRLATVAVLVLLALTMLLLLLRRVVPGMRGPIALYVAAIVIMGVAALTTGNAWVMAGALLFIASDAILATENFLASAISPHRDWMRYAVWILYVAAQFAIALGLIL